MIPLTLPPIGLREIVSIPKEDYIRKLKHLLQTTFEKENVVLTADGRNALHLAFKAMGLQKEDEVLLPAYACYAVRAVLEPICRPVYVDIDPKTFNIDPRGIESYITKNTKAVLVAHLYGNPCDMDKITAIAKAKNLLIIEDVAQALGARYNGKMLGTFGDYAMFSFRFSKDITSFRGGALLAKETLDPHLVPISTIYVLPWLLLTTLALRQLRVVPAAIYSPVKKHVLTPLSHKTGAMFKVSYKTLCNYQCYLLYQQFERMGHVIEKRRRNAAYYFDKLGDICPLPTETNGGLHTYFRYTLHVEGRDDLYYYLLEHGIEADRMYDYSLAPQDTCPRSVAASQKNLNIPVHHELSERDVERISDIIRRFGKVS